MCILSQESTSKKVVQQDVPVGGAMVGAASCSLFRVCQVNYSVAPCGMCSVCIRFEASFSRKPGNVLMGLTHNFG